MPVPVSPSTSNIETLDAGTILSMVNPVRWSSTSIMPLPRQERLGVATIDDTRTISPRLRVGKQHQQIRCYCQPPALYCLNTRMARVENQAQARMRTQTCWKASNVRAQPADDVIPVPESTIRSRNAADPGDAWDY